MLNKSKLKNQLNYGIMWNNTPFNELFICIIISIYVYFSIHMGG